VNPNSDRLPKKTEFHEETDKLEKFFEIKKYSFYFSNPKKYWGPSSIKVKAK